MPRNISVFQVVVIGTFAALAVAGVFIFAFVVGGNATGTIGEVEIWGTLDEGAFTTILRQLAEDENRFRQVSYVQKNPETFERELTDALASGTGPELYVVRQDYAEKDHSKILPIPYESFPLEQFQATFVEGANPFLAPEGVLAVPFAVDPLVLYWNRDLLSSAGFAKPPDYWDELFGLSSAVTKRSQTNSIEKSGVAFGEYVNVTHAKNILSMLILQADGSITARDTEGKLSAALVARVGAANQAAESALRFYTDFANPVKAHYSWNRALPESRSAFGAGDLGLYLGLASEEPLIRRINPNLNYAVVAMPQIRDTSRKLTGGYVYGFAIPRASQNPQGALTIAYLLAEQNAATLLSQALGLPSARRDVLALSASGLDDFFNKQAILVRSWIDPDPEKTDEIFRDMIQGVTSGSAKLSEAVQRADQTMRQLINDNL